MTADRRQAERRRAARPSWPWTRWCPRCDGTGEQPAPWYAWRKTDPCRRCAGDGITSTAWYGLWWWLRYLGSSAGKT